MHSPYGEFAEEAEEVLVFLKSGRLLAGGSLPDGVDATVIDDLHNIPADDDYYREDAPTWRDVLGNEAAVFYGIESNEWGGRCHYDRRCLTDFESALETMRSELFPKVFKTRGLEQSVIGLLSEIMHSRLVMGKGHPFYEMLFQVLRSGGFPCGWDGRYPGGRLIVYYPKRRKLWLRRMFGRKQDSGTE